MHIPKVWGIGLPFDHPIWDDIRRRDQEQQDWWEQRFVDPQRPGPWPRIICSGGTS